MSLCLIILRIFANGSGKNLRLSESHANLFVNGRAKADYFNPD